MMRKFVFFKSYFLGPDYRDHHKSFQEVLNPMLLWVGLQQISNWFGIFSRADHMQLGKYTCLNLQRVWPYLEMQILEKK